jgi:hypothetical protein
MELVAKLIEDGEKLPVPGLSEPFKLKGRVRGEPRAPYWPDSDRRLTGPWRGAAPPPEAGAPSQAAGSPSGSARPARLTLDPLRTARRPWPGARAEYPGLPPARGPRPAGPQGDRDTGQAGQPPAGLCANSAWSLSGSLRLVTGRNLGLGLGHHDASGECGSVTTPRNSHGHGTALVAFTSSALAPELPQSPCCE